VEFDVPESALAAEVNAREHDVIHSMNHDDALFERFLDSRGTTREEFTAELRENAIRAVRAQLILDVIADNEELSVGDAELTEYLVRQAGRYNMAPQQFADEIVKAGSLPSLIAEVRRTKALATALAAATITDASGNVVDLSALPAGQLDLTGQDDPDEGGFAVVDDDLDDASDDDLDELDESDDDGGDGNDDDDDDADDDEAHAE
jgi:trigger factor